MIIKLELAEYKSPILNYIRFAHFVNYVLYVGNSRRKQSAKRKGMKRRSRAEKREFRYSVYCTTKEAEQIREFARAAGVQPTAYLRRVGLQGRELETRVPKINLEKWSELARLVGLLNQIAKSANSGIVQNINPQFLEMIREEVQGLRQELITQKAQRGK